LAIFGIFTSGDRATAKFRFYYEGGCAYRGLITGRELDILSVGWVRADINRQLQLYEAATNMPILTNEQLVELTYTGQVSPWLQIRPGVQYDVRPGAASTHPNTWVYGLQIKATL
jgi:porin